MEKTYDLRIRCYEFSKRVVLFINAFGVRGIYYSIIDQLLRSATSIGANVIEGKSASSRRELVRFYTIALKSANETKYWLCLIRDTMQVDRKVVMELLQEANELSKIIAKCLITLKQSQN